MEKRMEDTMNLIFLDIDGVMNHKDYFVRSKHHIFHEFCPIAVQHLKEILETCKASIVVSSTWRKFGTVEELKNKIFSYYGLDKYIIGKTPVLDGESRGKEIRKYLKETTIPVTNFIIIDDDDDMEEFTPRLVKTSFYEKGLNIQKKEEAIQLFQIPYQMMI
jgi:hypothetical protein